jgi:hypothetical protein
MEKENKELILDVYGYLCRLYSELSSNNKKIPDELKDACESLEYILKKEGIVIN